MVPAILVVSTISWMYPARVVSAFRNAGFIVEAACQRGNFIAKLVDPPTIHRIHHLSEKAAIRRAILASRPDLIVPCDDRATRFLHELHAECEPGISHVIERSLGDPAGYSTMASKRALIALAGELGLGVPRSAMVRCLNELTAELEARELPIVLKRDATWGGKGVRILKHRSEMAVAWNELTCRSLLPALRSVRHNRNLRPLAEYLRLSSASLDVQDFVTGQPANRALLCDRGRVLGGISVVACETEAENGAASVVRIIEHDEMTRAGTVLAEKLGISGFCGLDFMISTTTGSAYLLEINPRAMPISHLAVAGQPHLPSLLFSHLTGRPPRSNPQPLEGTTVMLFPNEVHRDPSTPYLSCAAHDAPWDEPGLLDVVRTPLVRPAIQARTSTASELNPTG